jgi:hypothetical protein
LASFFLAATSGLVLAADAPPVGKHHKLAHKVKHKGARPGISTIKSN